MRQQRFALSILVLLHVLSGCTDAKAYEYAVPEKSTMAGKPGLSAV